MVRARLASLTVAGSLLATSGCMGWFEGGGPFSRWRCSTTAPECTCYDAAAAVPTSIEAPVAGPTVVAPDAWVAPPPTFTGPPPTMTPPPIVTAPNGSQGGAPPRIVPIPATPMPWTGQR